MLGLSNVFFGVILVYFVVATESFLSMKIPRLPRSFRSLSTQRKAAESADPQDKGKVLNGIHPSNAPGNLYVDESCIDCGMCSWMNPKVFDRSIRAYVKEQPQTEEDKLSAYSAMLACPTGSIRTHKYDPVSEKVKDVFPAAIDPVNIPGVFHAGFHTPDSFGETPYFIKRPGGNMLIGTPRFNERWVLMLDFMRFVLYLIPQMCSYLIYDHL